MARAWRTGVAERRAVCLSTVQCFEGASVCSFERRPGELLSPSELYLEGGTVVSIGRSHGPTLDRLAKALEAGPVLIRRVADHRRFFGMYFQTLSGPVALLVNEMTVRREGGGRLRPAPSLLLA